jgi:predicted MFS family arabinose efflux permease
VLFGARIVNAFAFNSAFPFLAAYLAADRGMSSTAVGVVYMSQGIAGAAFQLVGGQLADRFGRRPLMLVSLLARSIVALSLGLLVHFESSLALFSLLILLNACLAGLFQPAADALVVDLTEGRDRIAAFSHQRVAINIGWALGPILGGFIAARTAFELLFFAAAPLVLVGAFVISRLPEPPRHAAASADALRSLRTTLSDRPLRLQLLGSFLTFMLAGQMVVTLSVDGAERFGLDRQDIGLLWTLNGVLVVGAQMSVARVVQRLGTRVALVTGSLVYALAYASVGFVESYGGLLASMVAITAGELLNAPSQQTAIAARARPQGVGAALGLLGLVMMLGRSLGPLLGGAAHDAYGGEPALMWGLVGSVGVLAALVYLHPALRAATPVEEASAPVPVERP